ncbi:myo-inosose-2 dehydratase, partial [Enterococcus faecalis]
IAWTNDEMPVLGSENTFEHCVSEMALAGFKGTEIGNKFPKDPQVLKHYLDIRGLKVERAGFSTFLTTTHFEETADD